MLVLKLHAILLLEANFNAADKIIFNTWMIPQMERKNEILRKIIGGQKSQSVIHIAISKKIIVDISNQSKQPHVIISVDTSNYFDWVAYLILVLTCQYFELP